MESEHKMTEKQKRFCQEYLIDLNATQACIRAGYKSKCARMMGVENLSKPYIREFIDRCIKEKESKLIATQDEVLRYLTSVLRGTSESEYIAIEGCGDGISKAIKIKKNPDEKDRLKASEQLGKYFGLNVQRIEGSITVPVVIKDDVGETDE